jgi:hypothetical protein
MNPALSPDSLSQRLALALMLCVATLLAPLCRAAEPATTWFDRYEPEVVVAAPYIDLRSGPGRGYPVFHSVMAGETLVILKRRTGWLKVRAPRGTEGWMPESGLTGTLGPDGQPPVVTEPGRAHYVKRRWEFGIGAGDFDGASSLSAHLGFALTPNILLLVEGSQILGDYSDAVMASGNLVMIPFPEWRVSPFFRIGTGIIETRPHSTIVRTEDRNDEIVNVGVGATMYLGDRFLMRTEYLRHTVLTSRDENQEIDQWKAGFSVYF